MLELATGAGSPGRDPRLGNWRGPWPKASQAGLTPSAAASVSRVSRDGFLPRSTPRTVPSVNPARPSCSSSLVLRSISRREIPRADRTSRNRCARLSQLPSGEGSQAASDPKASQPGETLRAWASASSVGRRGNPWRSSKREASPRLTPAVLDSASRVKPALRRAERRRSKNRQHVGFARPRVINVVATMRKSSSTRKTCGPRESPKSYAQ